MAVLTGPRTTGLGGGAVDFSLNSPSSIFIPLLSLSFLPDPYTTYKFWLKAFTLKNEGQPSSPPYEVTTDVGRPGAPVVTNLACKDASSLYVEWQDDPTPAPPPGRTGERVSPFNSWNNDHLDSKERERERSP